MQNYISIGSVIFSGLSVLYTCLSFKENKKVYIISQTPVLIPNLTGIPTAPIVSLINTHKSGVAKNVCISLEGGKLDRLYSLEKEFLAPGMKTRDIKTNQSIDGSLFKISYVNIFDKKITVKGSIHYLENTPDLQNIEFKIESVTN